MIIVREQAAPKPKPAPGQAVCHPERRATVTSGPRAGLCVECWLDRRAEKKGKARIKADVAVPPRVPGVRQHAYTFVPSRCPKCGGGLLTVEGRCIACRGHMGGCGWTGYLVAPS